MESDQIEVGRTAGPGPGIAVGIAALGVAAILLVIAARQVPVTLCDPMINLPILAFAASQAAFVLALGALRRAGLPSILAATLPLAWALLAAATLALRESAGDFEAIGRGDLLMAGATALGLFLMFHGMGLKLEVAGTLAWLLIPVLAFGLSLGWLRVIEDGVPQRTWRSWHAVNQFADALTRMAAKTGHVPKSGGNLDDVIAELVPTHASSLPRVDGWGRELEYVSDGTTWDIASLGAFGERGPLGTGPVRGHADDLVIASSGILSWPESPCGALDLEQVQELREPPSSGEPERSPAPPGVIDKRGEKR